MNVLFRPPAELKWGKTNFEDNPGQKYVDKCDFPMQFWRTTSKEKAIKLGQAFPGDSSLRFIEETSDLRLRTLGRRSESDDRSVITG